MKAKERSVISVEENLKTETEYAIEIQDVYKHYRIYRDKGSQLKEKILFRKRNNYTEHKVLNGVTINIGKVKR